MFLRSLTLINRRGHRGFRSAPSALVSRSLALFGDDLSATSGVNLLPSSLGIRIRTGVHVPNTRNSTVHLRGFSSSATSNGKRPSPFEGMSEVDVEKELLKLKRQIGQFYSQGRYDEALESAIDMQTKIGDLMGTTNVMYASALNNVALMSKMCFDFERAIETYTEALHVYEDVVGRKHPSYMVTLSNLGAAYRAFAESKKGLEKQELLQRAMEALHDAYDFHKEIHGEDHRDTLVCANHIASLHRALKKPEEAERWYLRTLELSRNKHGEWDGLVATTLNNLGLLLKSVGRPEGAMKYYNEALTIRSKTMGEKHPDTIVTMHNIAELHISNGDEESAREIQEALIQLLGGDEAARKIIYGSDSADQGEEEEGGGAPHQGEATGSGASFRGDRVKCDHHSGADQRGSDAPSAPASEQETELDRFMRENKRAWVPIPAAPKKSSGGSAGQGADGDEKRET